MKLESYQLKDIDKEKHDITVEFVFDDETVSTQTIHLKTSWDEPHPDNPANSVVVKGRKFDLTDPETFDKQIKEYAEAYIRGIEQEKFEVSPDLKVG